MIGNPVNGTSSLNPNLISKRNPDAWPPRRIAVLRALNLGDLLHAVPALRALRRQFPNAEITLIGLSWARAFASRFSHYIDRFLEFPGYPEIVEAEPDVERMARFFEHQRSYRYDLAIQMHGSGYTSNSFIRELGASVTAGFYDARDQTLLNVCTLYPHWLPESERNLRLVQQLGCGPADSGLEFPLFPDDHREADGFLDHFHRAPLIGIHAGARAPSRRWPLERYAHLADDLARDSGGTIVLTGGPGEVRQTQRVESLMCSAPVNLAGQTSLGGLAATIDRFDLFISNDTGPAHIARALGTPSITVFGPADPLRWAPQDQTSHRVIREPVHCSPCMHWECPIDHRCLDWIPVSRVLAEARQMIAQGRTKCIA